MSDHQYPPEERYDITPLTQLYIPVRRKLNIMKGDSSYKNWSFVIQFAFIYDRNCLIGMFTSYFETTPQLFCAKRDIVRKDISVPYSRIMHQFFFKVCIFRLSINIQCTKNKYHPRYWRIILFGAFFSYLLHL